MGETTTGSANGSGGAASDTGIGALLRASRMRVGEELRDVADMLRIRYPYLEAIEDGRFGDLPGQAYAVGFVRAYADHLGLDSEEVVRRYKEEATGGGGTQTDLRFPTPVTEASVPGGALVFIGLLIALLAYGGWYISTSDENYLADLIEPLPDRLAALVSQDDDKPAPPAKSSASEVDDKPAQTPPKESMTPAKAAPVAPAAAPAEPAVAPKPAQPVPAVEPAAAVPSAEPVSSPAPVAPAQTSVTPPIAKPSPPRSAPTVSVEPAPSSDPVPAPAVSETAVSPPSPQPNADTASADAAESAPASEPAPSTVAVAPTPEPAGTPTPAQTAPETTAPALSQPPPTETASLPGTQQPAQAEAATEPAAEPIAETAPEEPAADPALPPSRVLVRAKSNSWIQIKDDFSNETLLNGLLQAGEEYRVPDKFGLRLLTGNAGALEILVDGEPVPPIGEEGAVRRGVQLDPALLKAGTAVSE